MSDDIELTVIDDYSFDNLYRAMLTGEDITFRVEGLIDGKALSDATITAHLVAVGNRDSNLWFGMKINAISFLSLLLFNDQPAEIWNVHSRGYFDPLIGKSKIILSFGTPATTSAHYDSLTKEGILEKLVNLPEAISKQVSHFVEAFEEKGGSLMLISNGLCIDVARDKENNNWMLGISSFLPKNKRL